MQRLSRDKYTTILDATLSPAITIASGDELLVETWDAYKGEWRADRRQASWHRQPGLLR